MKRFKTDRGDAELWIPVILFVGALVIFGVFSLWLANANRETHTVTVDRLERVTSGDSSKYLVFTEDDGVFENTDSLWHGKFDSSDLYGEMEEGETYVIDTYGYRIPFLSMYPNIIDVDDAGL